MMMLALVVGLIFPGFKVQAGELFTDMDQAPWAEEAVQYLVGMDVLGGYGDGTFRPTHELTRAHAANVLASVLSLEMTDVVIPQYGDVPTSHPEYHAIAAITEAGIMQGSEGNFNPSQSLSRAEMAAVLTRAFDLSGSQLSSLSDVPKDAWFYQAVDSTYTFGVTTGFEDGTFRPLEATTRAQFAVFLVRAMENSERVLPELLKEIYENEFELETYELSGGMTFGLSLPEELLLEVPELAMVAGMLENIEVTIEGAYQLEPNFTEMDMTLTLPGAFGMSVTMSAIITEEKMWIKLPELPMLGLPSEVTDKFIEIDMNELADINGTSQVVDIELQQQFAKVMYQLLFDYFGNDYYNFAGAETFELPSDVDANQIIKFELTNETLQPFMTTLFESFLPEMIVVLSDPEYADILGIPAEDLAGLQEALVELETELETVINEISNVVDINLLNQYIVINGQNQIVYDVTNVDFDIKIDDQTFGFMLDFFAKKKNINGEVEYSYGIPTQEEVIKLTELEELMLAQFEQELHVDMDIEVEEEL